MSTGKAEIVPSPIIRSANGKPLLKCWKCGLVSGMGNHDWDPATVTFSPSIKDSCGAHYYIRNGKVEVL